MPSTISGDANVSATEFGYLDGVTSALQTQINSKVTTPGAWSSWTPTVTAGSGTFTTASATGAYVQIGKVVHCRFIVTITTNGTAGSNVQISLPVNATGKAIGQGREDNATGYLLQIYQTSATTATIYNYDNTYPGANGRSLVCSLTYEAA